MDIALHILVLSPHRDDAAFSLSLSINRWLMEGHQVTLVNVFTRTNYAPYSDAVSVEDVSGIRRREDEAFVCSLGDIVMLDLELKDAPLRLGCDSEHVCDIPVSADDSAMPVIYDALLSRTHDAVLVLPLALGRHVDHRTARDAAIALVSQMPCAFYEDLPYAMREGAEADLLELRDEVKRCFGERLCPALCQSVQASAVVFKKKIAILYDSQIDASQADAMAGFSEHYGGAERLWVNDAWQQLAWRERLTVQQQDEAWEPLRA